MNVSKKNIPWTHFVGLVENGVTPHDALHATRLKFTEVMMNDIKQYGIERDWNKMVRVLCIRTTHTDGMR